MTSIHSIIIVDDSKFSGTLLTNALRKKGYDVIQKTDPFAALDSIHKGMADLIVTDLKMPALEDGLDFLRTVAKKFNHLPVIVISAETGANQDVYNLGLKQVHFMKKPVDPKQLIHKIKALFS